MKKGLTIFLQTLIILTSIAALIFLLAEPHFEGRNVNATLFEIYFKDPFLACAYIASISFFVALHQTFKLLGYMEKNELFGEASVRALRNIKYCALTLVGFVLVGVAYLFIMVRGEDDIAGGVAMGAFIILGSLIVAVTAALLQRFIRKAISTKSI